MVSEPADSQEADESQSPDADGQSLLAEATTEHPSDSRPWLFKPGVSGNPNGRPRKGQTAQELLRQELDRRAPKIVNGVLSAAEKGSVRAFAAVWDRAYGLPAQRLTLARDEDPAAALLAAMLQARGVLLPGETIALPPAQPVDDTPTP